MNGVVEVAQQIQAKIDEITAIRGIIKARGNDKARAIAEYDKALAMAIWDMRQGVPVELDGKTIENPPSTLIERLAKGVCWQEREKMETAEAMYKSAVSYLDSTCAQLNALQSLNRYLDRA